MKALVLSGGSIKGSYQAGAIRHVLAHGYAPDIVTGTSVGALNAAYLAAFAGTMPWPAIGEALVQFWLTQVTGPTAIMRKRGILEMGWNYVRKNWSGVVDTAPLEALLRRTLGDHLPRQGGIICRVAAANLNTAQVEYHAADEPDFLDAVMASTAEPIAMPKRRIGPHWYVDGGACDLAPVSEAIKQEATELMIIACQPAAFPPDALDYGKVSDQIGRLETIVSSEILRGDLKMCGMVNRMVAANLAPGKRHIDPWLVQPAEPLPIDARSFTAADVAAMVAKGAEDAAKVWPVAAHEGPGMAA